MIASGSDDKSIRIWDAKSLKEIQILEGHSDRVSSVCFNPDGNIIASGSQDQSVRIWDPWSGKEIQKLDGHSYWVHSVCFSPYGNLMASSSSDESIRIWDLKSGKFISTLKGHKDYVTSLCFSLGGNIIASGNGDKYIRYWDLRSFKEIQKLKGHKSQVQSISFCPLDSDETEADPDTDPDSICFSPIGEFIATMSQSKCLTILISDSGIVLPKNKKQYNQAWVQQIKNKQSKIQPDDKRIIISTLSPFDAQGADVTGAQMTHKIGINLENLFIQHGAKQN